MSKDFPGLRPENDMLGQTSDHFILDSVRRDEPGCPNCDEQLAAWFGDPKCTPLCGCWCHEGN